MRRGDERGGKWEMQRESRWREGIVDWKERESPRIRPRDKGMTTVACFSCWRNQTTSLALSLLFLLSFSIWKARKRTKTRSGRRYANRGEPIVHIHGVFCLPRSLLLRIMRSLRGKLLISYYNDERALWSKHHIEVLFRLSQTQCSSSPAVISLLISRLRGILIILHDDCGT